MKHWSEELAEKIIQSGKYKPFHVDDMKTPSGQVHVGALRGVVIHDLIYKALLNKKVKAVYTYVFNDLDPMDGFPHYLPEKFKQYMGWPLYKIPSPEPGFASLAQCYALQYQEVFNRLGVNPKIIWSHELYATGKMDTLIKNTLDKVDKIRKLYHEISGYDKPKNWYPYQVICPKCGKVGTTIVTGWDGQQVNFECKKDLVTWAEGCGFQGKIAPIKTNGKLMWKVDWAAHWKQIKVTVEASGKDHMTEGGSHDLSGAISEQVFDFPTPYAFLYEWFLAKGGVKMSSSKGVGISAVEIAKTLPPEILKFLLVKTHYRKAIIFDPANNESILDLFDEYDRAMKTKDINWKLSQIESKVEPIKNPPRFRTVVNYIQDPKTDIRKKFSRSDKTELDSRIKFAKIWLELYAPEKHKVGIVADTIPMEISKLQRDFLTASAITLQQVANTEDLQQKLYQTTQKLKIYPKEAFEAIYLRMTGKKYGPKAAWFLMENKAEAIKRFTNFDDLKTKSATIQSTKTDLIKLSPEFSQKYPSASIGFAVIEGIRVDKFNQELETERQAFAKSLAGLTTEELGQSPELLSYRKMYKDMGIDWHSKRPSPEALLRRIATGKGLYNPINVIVDAYNLVVMKNKISCGAFDLDKMKLPAVLDIAKGGEKALFIGDKKPTVIQAGEVCYFDQNGAYNIDYNYRDAIRSLSTEKTTNVWINTEGVYNITPEQVQKTLEDAIAIITKYCGGNLKTKGLLLAKDYDQTR